MCVRILLYYYIIIILYMHTVKYVYCTCIYGACIQSVCNSCKPNCGECVHYLHVISYVGLNVGSVASVSVCAPEWCILCGSASLCAHAVCLLFAGVSVYFECMCVLIIFMYALK